MAGTYNNTTGYIEVNGVYADEVVVGGKYRVDSEWVLSLINPAIAAEIHLDSDSVSAIANTVRLNDLIDSDAIAAIAALTLSTSTAQTTTNTTNIATNTANIATNTTGIATNLGNITTNTANIATNTTDIATNTATIAVHSIDIVNNDSDILALQADVTLHELRIDNHDSDIARLALTPGNVTAIEFRVSSLENNDTAQDASITGNATDIAALKTLTGQGTALTTTATTLAGAVNELDAEIGNITNFVGSGSFAATNVSDGILELLTTQTALSLTSSNLEVRVAALETLVNALVARVGGGSTPFALNDLSDVTTGTPTTGQQLTWNGADWVAANDQV